MNFVNKIIVSDFRSSSNNNHFAYLNGLRGLAASIVVIFHFLMVFYPATVNGNPKISHIPVDVWLYNSPFGFFYNGRFAVSIFFVLSGYVLTKSYFINKDKEILIKRLLARYPRLFIPSVVSMLFAFVLLQSGAYQIFHLNNGASEIFNYSERLSFNHPVLYTLNSIFLGIFFGDYETEQILNTVLWTMGIEFKGSLLVLSAAFFIDNIKYKNLIVGVIAVLVTVFYQRDGIHYAAFLLGMLFASNNIKSRSNNYWLLSLFIPGLYLGGYFYKSESYLLFTHFLTMKKVIDISHFYSDIPSELSIDYFYYTLGAIITVYCTLKCVWLQKIFASGILMYLGKISFSLYLMHQPIINSLCAWIVLIGVGNYHLSVLVAFITMIVLSWLIAHFMTQTVDKFSINTSKALAKVLINS
ncbi:MAG: acyltransferase [Nostoc sp.]|uniref:acyltransferase family protein n=1 Tax=Nostoc sp. TaxID=1180 RepID=UPI002FF4CE62